jgi:uncharacterized membrane protein AbrB (regulator of aidB expression)
MRWLVNRMVANIGSGILGGLAWETAKIESPFLFIVCIVGIIVWNYLDGLYNKYNK